MGSVVSRYAPAGTSWCGWPAAPAAAAAAAAVPGQCDPSTVFEQYPPTVQLDARPRGPTDERADGCTLKRYGSADSLSAWSPSERARGRYALRKIASVARRPAPALVDRRALDQALRGSEPTGRPRVHAHESGEPSSNQLRAENKRLKREMQVMQNELKGTRSLKQRSEYEKLINKEYCLLNNEFVALKEESLRILNCGVGDQEIGNRIQAYLTRSSQFFHHQLSRINSIESNWSLKYKARVLEHLKKLFIRNVCQMDDWIDLVIRAK